MSGLIALVGLPGVGKSTIGRQLARRLAWDFVDTDSAVEKRLGCSIRAFFDKEGESRFRDIEGEVIAQLSRMTSTVLATGGGVVMREANRKVLNSHAHVLYLRSTPEELFRRLRNDTQRPLLQVSDLLARLRELHAERDLLYREVAHFVIETGRPSVASLVNMVLMQLELAGVIDPSMVPSPIEPLRTSN
ncbi:MAG: shikimate kinase [Rhizobacter sp.]